MGGKERGERRRGVKEWEGWERTWDGTERDGRKRRKGREREERSYSLQTSIPGAATDPIPIFRKIA